MKRCILAIGIMLLFFVSALAPITFGFNINDISNNKHIYGCNNRGWSSRERVSKDIPPSSYDPSLMVDSSGTVHVAWYTANRLGFLIYYNYKVAGGSWNNPEIVITNIESSCLGSPSLYVEDDGTVHVVWEDNYLGCFL